MRILSHLLHPPKAPFIGMLSLVVLGSLSLEVHAEALRVDEDIAVSRVLARTDILEVEQSELDERVARSDEAISFANPQLRVRHRRFDRFVKPLFGGDEPNVLDGAQVNVRFRLPGIDRIVARGAASEALVQASKAQLATARRNLRAEVREAFRFFKNAQRRLALAESTLTLSQKLTDLTERRVESKVGTTLDLGLARLDLLNALSEKKALESKTKTAERDLRQLMGIGEQEVVWLESPTRCAEAPSDLRTLSEKAKEESPVFEELRAEIRAVKSKLLEARLGAVPWFDFVEGGWSFGEDDEVGNFGLRVGISLPLWNFGSAEARTEKARMARRVARLKLAEREFDAQVIRAAEEVSSAHELVELYRSAEGEVLAPAEGDARRAMELGQSEAVELALLNKRMLSARRAALRAELSCERAQIDLMRLLETDSSAQ